MHNTENYGFKKPDPKDIYDIGHQNENWDIADNLLAEFMKIFGYEKDDIYGVEVDFETGEFTRLASAKGKTAGADFNQFRAYGGRRRCNITDTGEVTAYHGDPEYTETGKNSAGESVQVMVEQPAFFYKVVPLAVSNGVLKKARYYISDTKKEGFKLHPAFMFEGKEVDKIYLAAFEGCLQKSADKSYIKDNSQGGFSMGTYFLSSVAGAFPTTGYAFASLQSCAELRQEWDIGWFMSSIYTISATQLLFLIEHGTLNVQKELGSGIVIADGAPVHTGLSTALGNNTGVDKGVVSYRGEENLFGNVWTWLDKITCKSSYVYIDGDSTKIPFKIGQSGYITRFAYNADVDWIFFPVAVDADMTNSLSEDYYETASASSSTAFIPLFGGSYENNQQAGLFTLNITKHDTETSATYGARLVYMPGLN
jgi:hypothetical protein